MEKRFVRKPGVRFPNGDGSISTGRDAVIGGTYGVRKSWIRLHAIHHAAGFAGLKERGFEIDIKKPADPLEGFAGLGHEFLIDDEPSEAGTTERKNSRILRLQVVQTSSAASQGSASMPVKRPNRLRTKDSMTA